MSKTMSIKFADFETTGENYFKLTGRAEVRLAALSQSLNLEHTPDKIKDKGIKVDYFTDTKSFIKACFASRTNTTIFFNNFKKFDGEFFKTILEQNLNLIDDIGKVKDFIKEKAPIACYYRDYSKAVEYVKDENNNIISIRVSTAGKIIKFNCFLLLYQLSVVSMLKALKWNDIIADIKQNEDYTFYDCPTEEFLIKYNADPTPRQTYMYYDIAAMYAYTIKDINTNEFSPITYHKTLPLSAAQHAHKAFRKLFISQYGSKTIESYFNYCWNEKDYITFTNICCRGGLTFGIDKYKDKIIENINSIDCNSEYPSIYYQRFLPYGKFRVGGSELLADRNRLNLLIIDITYAELLDERVPACIPKMWATPKGRYVRFYKADKEWPSIQLGVWEEQLKQWSSIYKLTYSVVKVYSFRKTKKIGGVMKPFIDKKFDKSLTAGEKDGAKLIINSWYGKWGERYYRRSEYLLFSDFKKTENVILENKIPFPKYPAISSYIAAMGQVKLMSLLLKIVNLGGIVYYGDTDSLKFTLDNWRELLKEELGDELGKWKVEGENLEFKFLGPKLYMYKEEGKWHSKMKGYNKQIDISQFNIGAVLNDKLARKRVEGGVYLMEQEYTINCIEGDIVYGK